MRKSYKDAFLKKHNIKLGFMSAFVKAAAYALSDQPAVNGGTQPHLDSYSSLSGVWRTSVSLRQWVSCCIKCLNKEMW